MWSVYKIENRNTGKAYIGITGQKVRYRWKCHYHDAQNGFGSRGRLVHAAMRKHGLASFSFEVIGCTDNAETAKAMERTAIRVFGSIAPGGYNLTVGGDGTAAPALATRAKMRAAQLGKRQSPELIEKRRQKIIGCKHSPESVERSAAARRGAKRSDQFRSDCRQRAANQFSDPAARKRVSEMLRLKWKDPAYREAMLKARRKEAK